MFSVLTQHLHVSCLNLKPVCPCRLGRSKTLLTSLTLSVVFGVLVCVSPYPSIFIVMRFCLAAASAGVYLTLYIMREYFIVLLHMFVSYSVERRQKLLLPKTPTMCWFS